MRQFLLVICALLLLVAEADARSALSPRHNGMDAPGTPRPLPMPSYTDAYGNGLTDKIPEEKKRIHRPRPGAYGGPGQAKNSATQTLPLAPADKGRPLWGFQ